MKKLLMTAFAAALLSPAASAMTQEDVGDAAEAESHTSTNRIVCQRVPAPTGSRVGARRICKTEAQWDRINREARETVEEAFNRSKTQGNE